MTNPSISFAEEFSAKIPALALLINLGYQYLSPTECNTLRGKQLADKSSQQVVLTAVMRAFLSRQTFNFAGQEYPLSDAAIDKVMHELTPAMNLGLQAANERLYDAMICGVTVTEFIDGKKA